jgi:hypothetical protein
MGLLIERESNDGDASGLKAKRLITVWTSNLATFNGMLAVKNQEISSEINKVSEWAKSDAAKWNEATYKEIELFKYSVKGKGNNLGVLGAIVGALLAAGVIAIAKISILNVWATAGIITASAATGAGGTWMIASLKGAWITKKPEIIDINPRGYTCGKKQRCTEFTRMLYQPINSVCDNHASANACIKNFVVINKDGNDRFIVDPWVPAGVPQNKVLIQAGGAGNYAEKLKAGYFRAKEKMQSAKPSSKKVAGSYRTDVFINEDILGKYVPSLGEDLEALYRLDNETVSIIKNAAKRFAISEKMIEEGGDENDKNLQEFSNYAYEFHFVYPKLSVKNEISYPTVGLNRYLEMMANEVAVGMAVANVKACGVFNELHKKHIEDYIQTLKIYTINQKDTSKKVLLNKELENAQRELDTLLTLNALSANQSLDDQLLNMNTAFIASNARLAGAQGAVAFTPEQKNFLRSLGKLRKTRKTQLKALAKYKEQMAANGNMERANNIANASKKFSQKFASGNGAFTGFGPVSSSVGPTAVVDKTTGNSADKNSGYDLGSAGYSGSSYGSGKSSSGRSSSADGVAGDSSGANTENDEDSRRLAEAIEARDKANKDKYKASEGMTLFEQVTNAYIRNYDRVLNKKKGKNVIEQK